MRKFFFGGAESKKYNKGAKSATGVFFSDGGYDISVFFDLGGCFPYHQKYNFFFFLISAFARNRKNFPYSRTKLNISDFISNPNDDNI
jgi:hypothetical protein